MGDWQRYAVYYTATGLLADFGAAWLGWDIDAGAEIAHPDLPGLSADRIAAVTATARRYGFHATLKPPFTLAPDSDENALVADLVRLTASQPAIAIPGGLRLAALDGFAALISEPHPALNDLAARLVRDLDHHRAPLTPADRARRNPERLTEPQRDNLDRWGYPWVMDQFRFHMTLGGRLPVPETMQVIDLLRPHLAALLPDPHPIDAITLAGEDDRGRFHLIERIALTG